MEKLDYEKLIDPLCIPTIKLLRENLGIETNFCCQGKSDIIDNHDHSLRGYISVTYTPKVYEMFRKFYESEIERWKETYINDTERYPLFRRLTRETTDKVVVYLPRRTFTAKEIKEEWEWIYSFFLTYTQP